MRTEHLNQNNKSKKILKFLSKVLDKEKLSNKIKEFAEATKSSKEWQAKPQRPVEGERTAEQLTRMDGCRLSGKDLNNKKKLIKTVH